MAKALNVREWVSLVRQFGGNRFSQPVTTSRFVRQLLVCFLRLAAAPRISATARPRDAFHVRTKRITSGSARTSQIRRPASSGESE